MGYRLVPTGVTYPTRLNKDGVCELQTEWVNRGVGRALRDYEFVAGLVRPMAPGGTSSGGNIPTSKWVADEKYAAAVSFKFADVAAGDYDLAIGLFDRQTAWAIELPLENREASGLYSIGQVSIR